MVNKKIFGALAILLLYQCFVAPSSSLAATISLTLEQSIQRALQSNPAVEQAKLDVDVNKWGLTAAKAVRVPAVTWSTTWEGSLKSGTWNTENNGSPTSVQIDSVHLFPMITTDGKIDMAKNNLEIAKSFYGTAREDIVYDATKAYFNVLAAQDMERIAREQVANLQEHLNLVTAQYETGVIPRVDVLRSQVELANSQQVLIKSSNVYKIAQTALATILQYQGQELKLLDAFSYAPYEMTLDRALETSLAQRKDLKRADLEIKNSELNVKVAEAAWLPTVSGRVRVGNDEDTVIPYGRNWGVGVSVSWPIFDNGMIRSSVEQSRIQSHQSKLSAKQVADSAYQAVTADYLNMREAEKRLESTAMTVKMATEDAYIAREKYRVGRGINIEVFDAQVALTQAQVNQLQALYDYNVNKA
ncbi:MAG TPA: TolC family protein, partial [Negativicutes bacterium]|nr:TolC family protein [Negativicutes bacterium]